MVTGGNVMTRKNWLAAIGFLLLSQLLFWPLIHVAEQLARPQHMDMREQIEFVALDANGQPMFDGRRFTAQLDGNQGYYAPLVEGSDHVRFLIPFTVTDTGSAQGFFLSIRSDTENVRINDQLIQAELPTERQRGDINNEPGYYPLPQSALKTGANLLTLESESFGAVHDLGLFAVGDAADLYSSYRWKTLLVVDLPFAGIAILLFTTLLCFVVNWPREDRPRITSLVILLLLNAATTAFLTLSPQAAMPLWATVGLYAASSFAIGLAILQYALRDSAARLVPEHWFRWFWLAIPVIVGAALGLIAWRPEWTGFGFSWLVKSSFFVEIALGTLGSILLAYAAAAQHWRLWAERLALILCFSFFSLDRVASMTALHSVFDPALPLTLPWTPIVGVFLGMAIVISIARQASEARRTVVESNAILAAKLDEQDAELARSYEAQKQMLQTQVMLEERQRIVRDMHDGIGGQLLGLMVQVRGGAIEPRLIEQGLESSIADLRLIVDSMDTADGSLTETLRSFEHRVRAQVEAAGMVFSVHHGLSEAQAGPGPRPTLQILRILQESVTNALRHSGAKTIALSSRYADDGGIEIAVTDDGRGIDGGAPAGRGLTSMRSRAAAVRGELAVTTSADGTTVALKLPVQPGPSEAAPSTGTS